MSIQPRIVNVSPVAVPRHAYAMGPSGQSTPAQRPMERARNVSIVLADGDVPRSRAASEAQQRAAMIQDARRQCGQRVLPPASRVPTKLKGLKESDLRQATSFGASSKRTLTPSTVNDAADVGDVPLELLVKHPWEVPRVDKQAMRDPYLRAQGLHKNNTMLGSHVMKRILNARTFHADDTKVDFNFKFTA